MFVRIFELALAPELCQGWVQLLNRMLKSGDMGSVRCGA